MRIYYEIPFGFAPEGVYVETVSGRVGSVDSRDWPTLRSRMLMMEPEDFIKIKKAILKFCKLQDKACSKNLKSLNEGFKNLKEYNRDRWEN